GLGVGERLRVEVFGVDGGAAGVGEDLKVAAEADVVAVAGDAVGNSAGPFLLRGERFDLHIALDLPVWQHSHRPTSVYATQVVRLSPNGRLSSRGRCPPKSV